MSVLILTLVAGAVTGLALGALGGGGSVLAVPALIYLLGFSPAATTASLIIVTATSATALYAHARDGNVAWKTGALFALAGVVPAVLAGAVAGHVPATLLTGAFAVVAALAAVRMLRPRRPNLRSGYGPRRRPAPGRTRRRDGFPRRRRRVPRGSRPGGCPGPADEAGGGHQPAGHHRELTGRAHRTDGDGRGSALGGDRPFTGAAILGAWDGKRLATKITGETLQRIFAYVLLVVAALMLADVIA